jgi:peptidoglycan/xylan/chitin deacetylase (PgdA/CDA1 family)
MSSPWLQGADVAVSLTFDLDADVGVGWRQLTDRLTSLSEAQYGAERGIARLRGVLEERDIAATFFVPGEVAQKHPVLIQELATQGHEVAHHGYYHLATDKIRAVEQYDELMRGIAALEQVCGIRPAGYRSPGWELTPYTLRLLVREGFVYDSSCMGDDQPYVISDDDVSLLELPVHWSLDDWVFFGFTRDGGGVLQDPEALLNTWRREFLSAVDEGRHVTYTMHPEVMGRGYRAHTLAEFIDWMRQTADVRFVTHKEVAKDLGHAA